MPIILKYITSDDDLEAICAEVQPDKWAPDNEMTSYRPDKLRAFLSDDKHLLLLAMDGDVVAGISLAYELPHPAGDDSLYIHELDTHPNYRRQGIGASMVKELKKEAARRNLSELWVGADDDNPPAKSLYESQEPYEVEKSIIYAYKV